MILVLIMRATLQRVKSASVTVNGQTVGAISKGFLILLGVGHQDTPKVAQALAAKIAKLRVFPNPRKDGLKGDFDLDLREVNGEALVVSQFTLHADTQKGRRPSFSLAARPEVAEPLYEHFCMAVSSLGVPVQKGVFGGHDGGPSDQRRTGDH